MYVRIDIDAYNIILWERRVGTFQVELVKV